MSNSLTVYQEKGLTAEEAKLVANWVESGKPGISNLRADFLFSIYNLGYTCQEINKNFPEWPLPALLWARWKFDWDARRTTQAQTAATMVAQAVPNVAAESMRQLLAIIQATNIKNEREILAYLANPDREKVPELLPKSLKGYGDLLQLLKDLTTSEKGTKDSPAQPSVFIQAAPGSTVNAVSGPVDASAVAAAMIAQMQGKKPDGK